MQSQSDSRWSAVSIIIPTLRLRAMNRKMPAEYSLVLSRNYFAVAECRQTREILAERVPKVSPWETWHGLRPVPSLVGNRRIDSPYLKIRNCAAALTVPVRLVLAYLRYVAGFIDGLSLGSDKRLYHGE